MRIVLDRLHFPVTALGPGRRLGVWFQGCSLACPGCVSQDTWDADDRPPTTVAEVLTAATELCDEEIDGVTISGGEPFEQPAALAALIAGLRRWSDRLGRELDLLVYSGLAWERLRADHAELLTAIDAVIPEPYVAAQPPDGPWRGSGNQPLVLLSELARRRFADADLARPSMQVTATDGQLWMIGVPAPGDLPRLTSALRGRGIELGDVSWRR